MKKHANSLQQEQIISTSKLLTSQEVCARLRISRPTLTRLIRGKALVGVRIGTQWRFTEEAIVSFLQQNVSHQAA